MPLSLQGTRPRGNRHVRKEDVLQDMRIAAAACPRGALSQKRYEHIGRYSVSTVRRYFGRWAAAMELALPEVVRRREPTVEEMIADMHRVADKCRATVAQQAELPYHRMGRTTKLSKQFYDANGVYGHRYLEIHLGEEHFGVNGWAALRAALGITDV